MHYSKDNEKDSPGSNNNEFKGVEASLILVHLRHSKKITVIEKRE